MPKSRNSEFDKECPICGGIIWGKGQRVLLEGAKISVCSNCAQHGVKIKPSSINNFKKRSQFTVKTSPSKRKIYKTTETTEMEIIPEYAKKIRNVRNSLGLNQDQFSQKLNEKPSLLRRIEAGKAEPTLKLAKKIEEVYKIKLIKKGDSVETNARDSKYMKKSAGSSLGDIAFIRKKE
jgi:putative transcription factor